MRGLGKAMSQDKQQMRGYEIFPNNYLSAKPARMEIMDNQDQLISSSHSGKSTKDNYSFVAFNKDYSSESGASDIPDDNLEVDDGPELDEDDGDMRDVIVVGPPESPPRTLFLENLISVSTQLSGASKIDSALAFAHCRRRQSRGSNYSCRQKESVVFFESINSRLS